MIEGILICPPPSAVSASLFVLFAFFAAISSLFCLLGVLGVSVVSASSSSRAQLLGEAGDLIGEGHVAEAVDARGQVLQFAFLNV
jgi:hypothetical protein